MGNSRFPPWLLFQDLLSKIPSVAAKIAKKIPYRHWPCTPMVQELDEQRLSKSPRSNGLDAFWNFLLAQSCRWICAQDAPQGVGHVPLGVSRIQKQQQKEKYSVRQPHYDEAAKKCIHRLDRQYSWPASRNQGQHTRCVHLLSDWVWKQMNAPTLDCPIQDPRLISDPSENDFKK